VRWSQEEDIHVVTFKYLTVSFRSLKAIAVAGALASAAIPQARAEGLAGGWNGGGIVVYASGERERARCHADYSGGDSRVSLVATCATPSGSVNQSAVLRKTGANTYAGSFYNEQFNVRGSIYVVVRGNTQSVSLQSSSGSASLSLHR
jgi:hypothetical protein